MDEQDAYYTRDRRMVPEGWGLPLAFALLFLALIGFIVAPSSAAILADPLAGMPY